jgi:hypothetical protein
MDTGWVGPVEPLRHYNNKVVWVPDRWQGYCPDTFALLPAQFAEPYFNLDEKVKEKGKVFCLGGPDFDENNCEADHLKESGLSISETKKVLELCCLVEPYGHSEKILQYMIKENHIPTDGAPFYVFIARDYMLGEYCNSLNPNKAWQLMNMQPSYFDNHAMDYWIKADAALAGCKQMTGEQIQTSSV